MKIEYFPDVDTLSFVFTEDAPVADGRNVENDEDVLVFYDEAGRILEMVVHHASKRFPLDQISAHVVSGKARVPSAA